MTVAEDADTVKVQKGPMPPYIAFKTLMDVIERMEREQPPTRVDASYLDTYAGGYRPTVIGNLQAMGLLQKTGEPTETLLALVAADEATRKTLIRELFQRVYADVLTLPPNSTQAQFLEVFAARGASGDTRRKAISFFLKGCTYAGIPVGIHWKTPAAGTRKPRNNSKDRTDQTPPPKPEDGTGTTTEGAGSGEIVKIDLGAAGNVVVKVDVQWLQLDDETFLNLRKAITALRVLATDASTARVAEASADEGDDDE